MLENIYFYEIENTIMTEISGKVWRMGLRKLKLLESGRTL